MELPEPEVEPFPVGLRLESAVAPSERLLLMQGKVYVLILWGSILIWTIWIQCSSFWYNTYVFIHIINFIFN